MRLFVDTINGFVTAVGAVITNVTVGGNDSLTLKKARDIRMLSPLVLSQTAGVLRVFSGKMHDQTFAVDVNHVAANASPLLHGTYNQMYSGDILTFRMSGSAGAGQIDTAILPMVYIDPDGFNVGNYITPTEYMARRVSSQVVSVRLPLVAGVAGGYSGATVLNAVGNSYALVGNTKYAVLGINTTVEQAAVTIVGPDTGNFRYPLCASAARKEMSSNWTLMQSALYGLPLIPVIDTANAGVTTIETVNTDAAAAPIVNLLLCKLAS